MQVTRTYPKKKVKLFNDLRELSQKYKVIAVIRMEKVRAEQLMKIRKKFGDELKAVMIKNNIAKKALADINVKGIDKLVEELKGQNTLIFTNMNPFKLYLMLDKNKIYLPAKGGDIATDDIIVPAGNTGLPPGPVLSEFREAKIQTKIEGGTIWISQDTVVAKVGDEISQKLASTLSKLGIKPIKAGMSIYQALEEGILYKGEDLKLDVDATRNELQESFSEALSLAINVAYPIRETIEYLLRKAYMDARILSNNSGYITKETVHDILYIAEVKAKTILEEAKKKGYS